LELALLLVGERDRASAQGEARSRNLEVFALTAHAHAEDMGDGAPAQEGPQRSLRREIRFRLEGDLRAGERGRIGVLVLSPRAGRPLDGHGVARPAVAETGERRDAHDPRVEVEESADIEREREARRVVVVERSVDPGLDAEALR